MPPIRSLMDFMLRAMQDKATEPIAEHERILASRGDGALFFKAVTDHGKPNKRLTAAAKAYLGQVVS